MNPDAAYDVKLSGYDLIMLLAGLKAYLQAFAQHRELDGGTTHPDDQWRHLQRHVGELIWRLEDAGAGPDTLVIHSDEAVEPRTEEQ
ncbi:hypothetical protein [Geodermatophilus sp. DSM 44513]|uniref:hypothetical protein n=1 Tax=Geodermatophilus sp. DSM 44513 TaxID=1528104 RepID=UPI001274D606|nr:hypothetical protein [Geodermatophilus sp. DSM 44513]WNV74266.1 hypothetical protein RTG05_14840 [Geodermatophilus sp. DSM 44513]